MIALAIVLLAAAVGFLGWTRLAAYPEIKHWMIGGHSLGGSMAAEFVKGHRSALEGIAFLAGYPADSTKLSAARREINQHSASAPNRRAWQRGHQQEVHVTAGHMKS